MSVALSILLALSAAVAGEGDAQVLALIRRLHREFGYTGPLVIEREIADEKQQQADIMGTAALLEGLRQELGVAR